MRRYKKEKARFVVGCNALHKLQILLQPMTVFLFVSVFAQKPEKLEGPIRSSDDKQHYLCSPLKYKDFCPLAGRIPPKYRKPTLANMRHNTGILIPLIYSRRLNTMALSKTTKKIIAKIASAKSKQPSLTFLRHSFVSGSATTTFTFLHCRLFCINQKLWQASGRLLFCQRTSFVSQQRNHRSRFSDVN